MASNTILTRDSRLCTPSPDFSSEHQTDMPDCLRDIFTWTTNSNSTWANSTTLYQELPTLCQKLVLPNLRKWPQLPPNSKGKESSSVILSPPNPISTTTSQKMPPSSASLHLHGNRPNPRPHYFWAELLESSHYLPTSLPPERAWPAPSCHLCLSSFHLLPWLQTAALTDPVNFCDVTLFDFLYITQHDLVSLLDYFVSSTEYKF